MFGFVLILAASLVAEERVTPNILLLVTDDQRFDTIGALGNPHIKTPHLDRLAREGFAFRNAYCMGSNSAAVCLPSRNMLMSGRYYFRWEGKSYASPDQANLPDTMRSLGYETWHEGKLGNTAREIEPRFEHHQYLEDERERNSGEHGKRCADDAIAFMKSRQAARPFCMYLAFEGPHDPRVAAPHYLQLYERERLPLPENYLPQHPFDNGELKIRDEALEAWPRTPEAIRRHLHEYYACISSIDGHIGRLLQTLQEQGELEKTLIVFTSDNGLAIGSHGLMGKQNLYDDGMKVPLLFHGPGIPQGESNALVYLLDIYPTLCELAGTPIPAEVDGKSLAPITRGQSQSVRDTLFLSYRDVQRAVRDERWKLIVYPKVNVLQLFDLQEDPYEVHDVANQAAHAERVQSMLAELRRWQSVVGDRLPLE
jgi:arylsulfatase A-like enzyme